MLDTSQLAAQLTQVLFKSTLLGIWMAAGLLWQIFIAAWPAFLLLGTALLIARRLR
ncbi:MAG: hypothetical protein Q8P49_03470 [Candidatus Liptonbacteria bacterium]|nr:hypothetical protein [Candidatus Liptonbacteria bacterium]